MKGNTEAKGYCYGMYRIFFEDLRDIALLIDFDGKIVDANKAAVMAYGYSYQ